MTTTIAATTTAATATAAEATATATAATAAVDDDITTTIDYPTTTVARKSFINRHTGRPVTAFQFQVYDLCSQIPAGKVSTYKALADALGSGSPRSIGQALKVNPFAPNPVPCHRVVASDFYIGGFQGDWGVDDEGNKVDSKRAKLKKEGVEFDGHGYVQANERNKVMFNDFKTDE